METKQIRKLKFAYPSGAQPLAGYTIKRGIGIGGFGEVYFALSDAGKEVALKRIQRNLDIELRGVRQCLNLKHINLISLWDICTSDDGESWVVMEYVPGDSLRELVELHPEGMPMDQVNHWFMSMAAGVAYLHSRGIVHRDLKPGNIFFDQDEQIVKIGDYGLSKFISCSRRSGQTESVGTFHYMAPEIGKGVYGKEIDIYAMGIILYEMLTGNVPFNGESSQEIIMKHLTADPDVSALPEPYASIVFKAMRKDPELRYRQVSELIEDYPAEENPFRRIGLIPTAPVQPIEHNRPARGSTVAEADDHGTVANQSDADLVFTNDELEVVGLGDLQVESSPDALADTQIRRVPPVQPLVIDDTEIVFGELRDSSVNPVWTGAAEKPIGDRENSSGEPIAEVVQTSWSKLSGWWFHGSLNTPIKFVLLVIAAVIFYQNSNWLLPTAISLGGLYLAYVVVRTTIIRRRARLVAETEQRNQAPAPASEAGNSEVSRSGASDDTFAGPADTAESLGSNVPGDAQAPTGSGSDQLVSRNNFADPAVDESEEFDLRNSQAALKEIPWRERQRTLQRQIGKSLARQSPLDRLAELLGSMLISAMVACVLAILGLAIFSLNRERSVETASFMAWAATTSVIVSWFLLVIGKFFEGREIDAWARRFVMLGVGVVSGFAASAIGAMLKLAGPAGSISSVESQIPIVADNLYLSTGENWWAAYVLGFAAIFVVLRWWKQTDPIRTTRLSLWSVAACIAIAVMFGSVFGIDLIWITCVAGLTAVITQFASPWVHPEQRTRWLLGMGESSVPGSGLAKPNQQPN